MAKQEGVQGVSYENVGAEYFEKRQLRRHARAWSLWALGVGAVISGDFFGWNYGLATGGFGGLFIATVIVSIMYIGLCYCLASLNDPFSRLFQGCPAQLYHLATLFKRGVTHLRQYILYTGFASLKEKGIKQPVVL